MKEPSVLQDSPAWIIARSNGLTLSIYGVCPIELDDAGDR
jgi:hypothetical protein